MRDNPPTASIQEEATTSTVIPFMPVFNNLVVFDQLSRRNDASSIKPDLADSWAWSLDRKTLTFKLHPGVKWHDGVAFTSADVKCTWDSITGKRDSGWRKNPRRPWYENLESVNTSGDLEVSFVLRRPQPSFIMMLASGFSPVYPCHVDAQTMRTHPIGTGPFKLAEFRRNRAIRLVRNSDYFKSGKPKLDAIEYRIIPNQGTRMLTFESGQADLTWREVNIEAEKNIKAQQPNAICDMAPHATTGQILYNPNDPTFKDQRLRRAIALAIDHDAFNAVMAHGKAPVAGLMLAPPGGSWGLSQNQLADLPGYSKDVNKSRDEGRQLMAQLGYGPAHHLQARLTVVNRETHVTPATLLTDQLRTIYIDATLDPVEISVANQREIQRSGYQFLMFSAAPPIDDPDSVLFGSYACKASTNYSDYCDPQTQKMIEEQSQTADPVKRKALVNAIDRRITQQAVRPVVFGEYLGYCRQPYVKNLVQATNGLYDSYRYEDVSIEK
ncbi:ABC transporter substrate-binding protein [Caballeronia sp. 15711]|uniref:ABC transporter substrate-binding protein n=1 Tax=Caballeronia sp. 15711 TaxID=3391029 RepID=UPI0039E699DC